MTVNVRRLTALTALACLAWLAPAAFGGTILAQGTLVVEDVRVHGNHSTPDEEVLRIAALTIGVRLEAGTTEAARKRLEDSGRFARVEIRQRRRSIEDPTRVALIILVTEHPSVRPAVDVGVPAIPGVLGRLRSQTMFLPILGLQDGYGLTYGLRTSFVGGRQSRTRLSVPASWGGTRQLAIEADRTFGRRRGGTPGPDAPDRQVLTGAVTRLRGGAGIWRQEHPYFEQGQTRRYVDTEFSYRPRTFLGFGATAGLASVSFGDVDDGMTTAGLFAEVDTRGDPLFPRNALFARSAWTRLQFEHPERSGVPDGARSRWRHDLQGYLGVVGQVVLAARLQVETADGPLPAYAQPIFGGADTLRGLRAGFGVADNLWSTTVEARAPITSPLRSTRFGVMAFYDTGAFWSHGQRWRDVDREEGVGAGVFLVNPFIRFQFSVARGLGHSTRVHASTGVSF